MRRLAREAGQLHGEIEPASALAREDQRERRPVEADRLGDVADVVMPESGADELRRRAVDCWFPCHNSDNNNNINKLQQCFGTTQTRVITRLLQLRPCNPGVGYCCCNLLHLILLEMSENWDNAGRWVKQWRLDRDWGYRDAAVAGRMSTGPWVNVEKGLPISDRSMTKISKALDWPPDAWRRMLDGLPPTADDDAPPRPSSHITDRDYNSDIAELPPDAQAIIDSIIDNEIKKQQG